MMTVSENSSLLIFLLGGSIQWGPSCGWNKKLKLSLILKQDSLCIATVF